jgi:sugar O-acyltransferase (sialic acid O-acetyltransferase NeuD family)
MPDIVIWGATGHAKVLHEALSTTDTKIVALVDNRDLASPIAGIPVLRGEAGLEMWLGNRGTNRETYFAVGVGGARGDDRLALFGLMKRLGLKAQTVIHRTAFVAADAVLGEGCQVLAGAVVCTHARLGDAVIVNTAASIDHDCVVGNGVHIAPGARLAGEIIVGARAFVGTGASVLPRIRIGDDAVVGAGSAVIRDVSARTTVAGNPARVLLKGARRDRGSDGCS